MRIAILTACAVLGLTVPVLAWAGDNAAEQLKARRLEAAEAAAQAVAPASRALLPSGCLTSYPTSAGNGGVSMTTYRTTTISATDATSATITIGRVACASDATKSAVLVNVSPAPSGRQFFLCSSQMTVTQNGRQFSSFRIQSSISSNNYTSVCDYYYSSQTFVMNQWSIYDNFDEQAAFDISFNYLFWSTASVTVPAYSGATTTPPTTTTPSSGLTPVSGWWWNSSQAGRGWGIGLNGSDRVFLGGFIYSSAAGNPATWAVATLVRSSSGSNTFAGTLQYCSGGQSLESTSPASASCSAGGDVMLNMSSTRAGRLTISRPFGVITIDLVPYDQF